MSKHINPCCIKFQNVYSSLERSFYIGWLCRIKRIGGGLIGCELAQAFAMLGSKVTIVEAMKILPKDDPDCVAVVRQSLKGMSVDILEGAQVNAVLQKDESTIEVKISFSSADKTITGSHLLVATGRKANVENLKLDKACISYTKKGVALSEVSKQVSGEFYKPKLFSKKVRMLVLWLQKLWW